VVFQAQLVHMVPILIAIPHATRPSLRLIILTVLLCPFLCGIAHGQSGGDHRPIKQQNAGQLKAEEVVENLVRMNLQRAQALQAYESTRIYRLEYKGFPGGRTAEMVVNVKYRAPGSKEFEIVSQSGSKMLIDRVFKKLMEGEKDAIDGENQKRIAVDQENYEFALLAYEPGPHGGSYVLSVKPRTKNKYLFQGKIWVDDEQFAIVRIEGEPAKNPSFWIKGTQIETRYINVNDFWLPAHNHSFTSVRLGGHADFTIEYKDYHITGASPFKKINSASVSGR
jgi:outer membrane lipoprotein-sorting protein